MCFCKSNKNSFVHLLHRHSLLIIVISMCCGFIFLSACGSIVSPASPAHCIGTELPQPQGQIPASDWNGRLRGGILFPYDPKSKFIDAVSIYRMNVIQLNCGDNQYDLPADSNEHYLYGNINNFTVIRQDHLAQLDTISQWAQELGFKIIIDLHQAPGRKWSDDKDYRLHQDTQYHSMMSNFWRQMAQHFLGNTNVIAFNLMDEPYYAAHVVENHEVASANYYPAQEEIDYYIEQTENTPADLNLLYKTVIAGIRAVDPTRVITIEPDMWGDAGYLRALDPDKIGITSDPNVIIEWHFYNPHIYTHQQPALRKKYPGTMLTFREKQIWNRETINTYFQLVETWRKQYNIPAQRIFLGEFNVCRWATGAERWAQDVLELVEIYGYHWTYYSFREDDWNVLDNELGPNRLNRSNRYFAPLMQIYYDFFLRNE